MQKIILSLFIILCGLPLQAEEYTLGIIQDVDEAEQYGGIANRLLSKENELTGVTTRYDYDQFDFLIREENYRSETRLDTIYRMPDRIGNLYGTPDKKDKKYGAGGRLEEDEEHFYHYDDEGNLIYKELRTSRDGVVNYRRKEEEKELHIKFRATGTGWRHDWQSNGMLRRVVRPDEKTVYFRYDALGRRTTKVFWGTVTRWIWDGNVPLHEWEYKAKFLQQQQPTKDNEENKDKKQQPPVEPTEDVTTWVFEAGTFVPAAKIKGDKRYSIVTDYLGTPIQMYDEQGEKTWDCTLDVYGKVANFEGNSLKDVPFRYQGQYEDEETGLYYNRFRYYDKSSGGYLSQDPIRLAGNNPTLYAFVHNPNYLSDPFGLTEDTGSTNLVVFGNATTPRAPRPGKDIDVVDGVVKSQVGVEFPQGASAFEIPEQAPLTGHYYEIDAGTKLPEGLAIKADGSDVISGSPHGAGHHTIYPTEDMSMEEFQKKYSEIDSHYGGKKGHH